MSEKKKRLSPVHIFKYVQNYVDKTNTEPIVPSIVKVNQDQINELNEDDDLTYPFARIDSGFPESHDQLAFTMDFFGTGVGIGFSGGEGMWQPYEVLGDTNKDVATVLTNILTGFSNGQLKVLLTNLEDRDHIQAIELLYKRPHQVAYDAIGTSDMFLPPRKLKHETLKTDIFTNHADIKEVAIDVRKTQLLLLPDVDPDIMTEIGRKNLIDLSEPLTPAILKQNIDDYATRFGDKVGAKVEKAINNKFDQFDANMGISGMSAWEQFVHFARWRHIELMVWGFAMLTAYHWATWTIGNIHPTVLLVGISLIPLYIFRKRYPYPQILYLFAPVSYLLFIIGATVFLRDFSTHWISWTIAVFAVISICESVFFDLYSIRQKILDKIYAWGKK